MTNEALLGAGWGEGLELRGVWQSPSHWNLKQMVLKLEVFNPSLASNVTAYYLPIYLLGMRALFEHKTLNMRKINHN